MSHEPPKPIKPYFVTPQPDAPVVLIDESAEITTANAEETLVGMGTLRVTQHWSPMRHAFALEGELELFERLEFEDKDTEKSWAYLEGSVQISGPSFSLQGYVEYGDEGAFGELESDSFEVGTDHKLNRVTFHVPNYPKPSGGKQIEASAEDRDSISFRDYTMANVYRIYHLSEIRLEAQGWRIKIQPLHDFQQLEWAADESYGTVINAVGEITKQELVEFKPDAAKKLLDALHYFLSFTFNEWTPPLFAIGSNDVKEKSWQYFKNYHIRRVRYGTIKGWLPSSGGDHLSLALQGFLKKWSDANWREPLRASIKWLVECSIQKDRDVQGAITFAQIPLEMLACMVFVDEQEIINENEFDKLSAASKLQLLLSHCKIDLQVPDSLKALHQIATKSSLNTGPKIITRVRNTIIHPNKKNREMLESWATKYSVSVDSIYLESHLLFEHYLTLIILCLIGYDGRYQSHIHGNDLESMLKSFSGVQVPWVEEGNEE